MSTKNLARTVIEGGRTRANAWLRRYSTGGERAAERDTLRHLATEGGLGDAIIPPRRHVSKWFHDKLGPPKRWMDRQVGRPWDDVRGNLLQRFDPRTTAGRHIVFDHMLPWVLTSEVLNYRARFRVDKNGILLRHSRWLRPRTWHPPEPLPRPERQLLLWLDGRRVGARGPTLFWFTCTATGGYRQHQRLSDEDGALWQSLPAWFRERHDRFATPPSPETART